MKSSSAPVVALRMEELLVWVAERVARFPKQHKFTIGDRWLESCLDTHGALVEAAYLPGQSPAKVSTLGVAQRSLTRARTLARVGQRLGGVSERQLDFFVKESDEVGRMLGAWTKQARGSRVAVPAKAGPA